MSRIQSDSTESNKHTTTDPPYPNTHTTDPPHPSTHTIDPHTGGPSPGVSPAGHVAAAVSLQQHCRAADLAVAEPLEPAAHRLLDLDARRAELVRPQLLQVRHLARPEEDLRLAELELVLVL